MLGSPSADLWRAFSAPVPGAAIDLIGSWYYGISEMSAAGWRVSPTVYRTASQHRVRRGKDGYPQMW